jgi:hypothetical protein
VAAAARDEGHTVVARPQDRRAHVFGADALGDAGGAHLRVAEVVGLVRRAEAGIAPAQQRAAQASRQQLPRRYRRLPALVATAAG